ncbi:MAG: hypothetical protein ABIV94_08145, partial [Acidimicrobiales bacterium]
MIGPGLSVRAATTLLPLVAGRARVYELSDDRSASAAAADVDRVVVDLASLGWTTDDEQRFSNEVTALGFRVAFRQQGITVYARVGT